MVWRLAKVRSDSSPTPSELLNVLQQEDLTRLSSANEKSVETSMLTSAKETKSELYYFDFYIRR